MRLTPWLITSFAPAVAQRMILCLLWLARHQVGLSVLAASLTISAIGLGLAHRRRLFASRN